MEINQKIQFFKLMHTGHHVALQFAGFFFYFQGSPPERLNSGCDRWCHGEFGYLNIPFWDG
jgi:hypothetical protein